MSADSSSDGAIAKGMLEQFLFVGEGGAISGGKIVRRVVAEAMGLDEAVLASASRLRELVAARSLVVWLVRRCVFVDQLGGDDAVPLSYRMIGLLLGKRDHTSMIHAEKRCEEFCARDVRLTALRTALLRKLMGRDTELPAADLAHLLNVQRARQAEICREETELRLLAEEAETSEIGDYDFLLERRDMKQGCDALLHALTCTYPQGVPA